MARTSEATKGERGRIRSHFSDNKEKWSRFDYGKEGQENKLGAAGRKKEMRA